MTAHRRSFAAPAAPVRAGTRHRERGQILPLTGIALVALVAVIAVAADMGYFFDYRRRMQTGADNAAMAAVADMAVSPHCSIGPVAFAAAIHFAYSTANMHFLESFGEFDVDWRNDLVNGWNPLSNGTLAIPTAPGLGIELGEAAIAAHPYKPLVFPSLWDATWRSEFTGSTAIE